MKRAIIVDQLVKDFEVKQRKSGITGAVSSLVKPKRELVRALKSISFSVSEGELVGFIGPNGAGKTTTLKILSGVLYPTSGFAQVNGFTPQERRMGFLKQIALVMGQKNQLWWDLPASESFELNRAIYEVPAREFKKSLSELTKLLEVEKLLSTPVRRLSLGQRMRLELVAALLHRPKIIFLDEPTVGLDVVAQQRMRDFIAAYNKQAKATILLTSHNMDDVADLARRVIVINEGEIIFDGKLTELVDQFAKEKIIKVYISNKINVDALERIGKIKNINLPEIVLSVPRGASKVAAAELLQNYPVDDLTIEEESIEEIIRQVFRGASKKK